MEIVIELTEAQRQEVAGGSGTASFSATDTASGTTAAVTRHLDYPHHGLIGQPVRDVYVVFNLAR